MFPVNHPVSTDDAHSRHLCSGSEHHYDSNSTSSNPVPPLQNGMFSLEKRGLGDDSGDSQDDSPGTKAAHLSC
jgi:hypothetical protein